MTGFVFLFSIQKRNDIAGVRVKCHSYDMSYSLMIHGGAGAIGAPERFAPSLRAIIETGADLLTKGASALDAVTECVRLLEDDPIFNAGRGSVLNADGAVYCDASIMDGRDLSAGAVAGVRHVRNPVLLARLVMERTPHVFLIGEGAERFGREQGAVFEEDSYFLTPDRQAQLARAKARGARTLDHAATDEGKLGTVGAVARDNAGNVAAATSTGGLVNQMIGRVGDSPVIGAGVFADNESCAVSCTGIGEQFLRTSLARAAAFFVEAQGMTAADAAAAAIAYLVRKVKGSGGLIVVDRNGGCGAAYSTPGMLRASFENGAISVAV
ncbi:isoaspartyl peptidase/L-asparaginase [Methylocystis sp. MJC1]|jgi:beta-aspartyl-peptidase (threonine type)|uniref:isoaspartyl peptidase/L-asparaginase family protein n=1 Tax=Methylocystis sp. MJC1 TaxID=2654282 RepID=UPI001FEEB7D0|nr:isoaspartyl peptidase/L-asparaginase family protein [Methylocystis sp. MJC1]KAF2991238.1 Isoaspartyl peptidase [Methylocystis sp. MJC1]UZX12676.1 isoaspartyl peptidase/L-asparaginase [Methylocystis sp. MJC1]